MAAFHAFLDDDAGAVTLDWVALSAGVVLFGIAVILALDTPLGGAVDRISSNLSQANSLSLAI